MNDTASWLTTSVRCARRRPRVLVARPLPADIARIGSFMKVSRGAHAKSIAIVVETTSVNASTRASSPISPARLVKRDV